MHLRPHLCIGVNLVFCIHIHHDNKSGYYTIASITALACSPLLQEVVVCSKIIKPVGPTVHLHEQEPMDQRPTIDRLLPDVSDSLSLVKSMAVSSIQLQITMTCSIARQGKPQQPIDGNAIWKSYKNTNHSQPWAGLVTTFLVKNGTSSTKKLLATLSL